MSYKLDASGFDLEITIERIEDLKLHEETIDSYLEELADAISDSGIIKDPVIVDKDSKVVLDGMHRVTATGKLGYKNIPVCLVDYHDSKIDLGSWCRFFEDLEMDYVKNLCEELGFEIGDCDHSQIDEIIKDRKHDLLLVSQEECFTLDRDSETINEIFEAAIEIEEELRGEEYIPRYETENDVMEKLKDNEVAILVPAATKEEVIEVSSRGDVFSHKTTRHVIPARPMRINVPLDLLEKDIEEADEEMTEFLKEREVEDLPPGSRFEGREYEEELVIFK